MKQSLLNEKIKSKNKIVKFDYDLYIKAVEAICSDIIKNYDIKNEKIGILGMARGGLPLLVSVSHGIGIREVSSIQLQMSNSDNCHDYGEVRIINECINDNIEKFILLEDIIYKGKTTNAAIEILKNRNVYILESNHDVDLLNNGPYPFNLRQRILGDKGHLSNYDCAKYLSEFIGDNTKCIVLAHLSEENNTKELAYNTLKERLNENDQKVDKIIVAAQNEETEMIEI